MAQVKVNPNVEASRINFHTNFESGSLDSVSMKDLLMVLPQMEKGYEKIVFDVYSKFDPNNPADPTLPPSARWYHFLMTGVKDKMIQLNMHNSDTRRPFYSYNGVDYLRFLDEECSIENSIVKKYEQDSVYIAYFTPYPESYLKSRITEWEQREGTEVISIGKSENGRNMPLMIVTDKNVPDNNKKTVYHSYPPLFDVEAEDFELPEPLPLDAAGALPP